MILPATPVNSRTRLTVLVVFSVGIWGILPKHILKLPRWGWLHRYRHAVTFCLQQLFVCNADHEEKVLESYAVVINGKHKGVATLETAQFMAAL